jgi:hypothetical protein
MAIFDQKTPLVKGKFGKLPAAQIPFDDWALLCSNAAWFRSARGSDV